MTPRFIDTKRGARVRVFEAGAGAPLVFLHGAGGLLPENPFLEALAQGYRVLAPELPGYGESSGEDLLDDMLDFALHGWDVVAALGLERPRLMGHSMGGMIAAEMACLAPNDLTALVLAAPAGLWLPEHPVPDLFALLPFEFATLLFHDPVAGAALLTGGLDFSDEKAIARFYITNARQMGMAGKILFPIPNRGLARRLYRLTAPAAILWGASDRLFPMPYAAAWQRHLPAARTVTIEQAGHMLPYEQPERFVAAVRGFLE
jgi:pimeloyl-ACP methyl ester carboxylesterase